MAGIQRWVGVVSLKRFRRCSHDVLLRDLTQFRADLGDIVAADRLGTGILEDLINEPDQDPVRVREDFLMRMRVESKMRSLLAISIKPSTADCMLRVTCSNTTTVASSALSLFRLLSRTSGVNEDDDGDRVLKLGGWRVE